MEMCIYPLMAVRLFFTVSACWVEKGKTNGFAHKAIRKDGFLKEIHSQMRIRPPPMTACELELFLC
jgi:hypothetical protein